MGGGRRAHFGPDSTTTDVLAGLELRGKIALVTGGSGGLGEETARALAEKGARVILTARDVPKGEAVARTIRAATGNDAVAVEELELASADSIRACARRVRERCDALHVLINNAGVMACAFARTAAGFELQFGTNHLGHFLLATELASLLCRGAPSRVVSVSSRGHHLSPVVFDDLQFERRPYEKWSAYGQSKTANVLFAAEWDRRFAERGVRAFAVHPGVIMTELARHLTMDDLEELRTRAPAGSLRFKTVAAGAATSVYAATAPELDGQGGCYLEDCRIASINDAEGAADGVRSYALDLVAGRRLWEVSAALVGEPGA